MAELLQCIKSCDLYAEDAAECLADACSAACTVIHGDVPSFPTLPIWAAILLSFVLVPLTGLFAGLTIGLLSLDNVGLRILVEGGDPEERQHAKTILPVRKQGNLLLCTLLLGNTLINSALSILLADLTTGAIGLISSTIIILIFGEIMPQSICTRHGLEVGARCIWLVRIFMVIFSPITFPISLLLDKWLGRDIGTVYSQEELKRLIDIHVTDADAQAESGLTVADRRLLIGALEYKEKRAKDVMTALEHTFLLEERSRLNFSTMLAIYKSGFTRIPVYARVRQNICAILLVKDLILIDPDDETELSSVLAFRGRNVTYVREDVKLDVVFKEFMTSANHMLLVRREPDMPGGPDGDVTGLITLEDVMEELIGAEILDESDIYEDVNRRLIRRDRERADIASYLAMFDHKLHSTALSNAEMAAVASFLVLNVEEFAPLLAPHDLPLKGLISSAEIVEHDIQPEQSRADQTISASPSGSSTFLSAGSWSAAHGPVHLPERRNSNDLRGPAEDSQVVGLTLYERGVPSDLFTLILQGKALIYTGAEGFELELGPWSTLGNRSLSSESYTPDFTAMALNSAPFRMLRISRSAYRAALEATQLSPVVGYQRARASAQAWKSVAPFDGVQAPPSTSDSSRAHSAWPASASTIPAARLGQLQRPSPGRGEDRLLHSSTVFRPYRHGHSQDVADAGGISGNIDRVDIEAGNHSDDAAAHYESSDQQPLLRRSKSSHSL
ncbi:g4385 [Coccomyxa viridis]|uniref:G4385 protein n=1 Tax=Coccomyxa viridis TaxID=1274662 RepID=A0ABP1FTA7_9CHLO